jgi:hypothetical protein
MRSVRRVRPVLREKIERLARQLEKYLANLLGSILDDRVIGRWDGLVTSHRHGFGDGNIRKGSPREERACDCLSHPAGEM